MHLTIEDCDDLTKALAGWAPPEGCEQIVIDAGDATKAVNMLLNSPIDCRCTFVGHQPEINMAGCFSMCSMLSFQPTFAGEWTATSLAAAFKGNGNCRYSMHWLVPYTEGCRDYRQMFWGAWNFSGNGVQNFDYGSVRSPDGMANFFGGGSAIRTEYYDQLLKNLHDSMEFGDLPTPMSPVDFGDSMCSPYLYDVRQELIDYGWDIRDAGLIEDERSDLEIEMCEGFDELLPDWESVVDTDAIATTSQGGVLITPKHLLYCDHWAPPVGKEIRLRSGDTAKIVEVSRNPGWDLSIAELDREMPVEPVELLDPVSDMPLAVGPPTRYPKGWAPALVFFNRNDQASVTDLTWVHKDGIAAQFTKPASPERVEQFHPIAVGDSGSPGCFVVDGRLVLALIVTNPGSGTWLTSPTVRDWIEEVTGYAT